MNPLLSGSMHSINGSPVVINDLLVQRVPHPRSLGRSRRRARLGHRQHYVTVPSREVVKLPDGTLIMHSAMWALLKATIDKPPGERPPPTARARHQPFTFGVTPTC